MIGSIISPTIAVLGILILTLACLCSIMLFSEGSFAEGAGETGDCVWSYDAGMMTLTITGDGAMADYAFDEPAPWGTDVKYVIITDGVTTVGSNSFYSCHELTHVSLGSSVESIGFAAFACCTNLENVELPEGVTEIGAYAFYDCEGLSYVDLGYSVSTIGFGAFAFTGLTYVTLPDSVCILGGSAFYDCEELSCVDLGNSIKVIGDEAFRNCISLSSVEFPNSLTCIGDYAFEWCALSVVNLVNLKGTVGDYAFCGCDELSVVILGKSVSSIGSGAFGSCKNLNGFNVENGAEYVVIDGVLYSADCTKLVQCPAGIHVETFWVPESVTEICNGAFCGCDSIVNVVVGDNVLDMGAWIFEDCTSLISVYTGSSVESIGSSAFSNCVVLERVYLGNSLIELGECLFRNCVSPVFVDVSLSLEPACADTLSKLPYDPNEARASVRWAVPSGAGQVEEQSERLSETEDIQSTDNSE